MAHPKILNAVMRNIGVPSSISTHANMALSQPKDPNPRFETVFFEKYFGYDYQQVFSNKYYTGVVEEATVLRWQLALWRYMEQPLDNTWMVSGLLKKHFHSGNIGRAIMNSSGYSFFPQSESEDRCMLTFIDEHTRDMFMNWRTKLYERFNLNEHALPVSRLIKGGRIEGWIADMNPDHQAFDEEMAFKVWAWICKHCEGSAWVIESSCQIVFKEESDYVLFTMAHPTANYQAE